MAEVPNLAQASVVVNVTGTSRPFSTRVLGHRGRRLILPIPVGKAPTGAWATPGTAATIQDAAAGGWSLDVVVRDRRLKPIPLLVVEAVGDIPLTTRLSGSIGQESPDGAPVVVIASGKGGTGKTTFAVSLAWHAATLGRRTAVIDADLGTGNCGLHFGLTTASGLERVLTADAALTQIERPISSYLSLFPGFSTPHGSADPSPWQFGRLVQAIEEIRSDWDLIVVDTGAGVHRGVTNLLLAATYVVLVTQDDPASYLGAHALAERIALSGALPRLGLVINRADDLAEALGAAERFVAALPPAFPNTELLAIAPDDPSVARALVAGRPLPLLYPHAPASIAYRKAMERLVKAGTPSLLSKSN